MEEKKRIIALGFFDGVHLGHAALLTRVREESGPEHCIASAVTFDHHPKDVIAGAEKVPLLNTPEDREGLMRRLYGIQEVIVLPFDVHMRDMPWREFVTELLVKQYHAAHLVAGHDFRFGRRGEGTPERLAQLCRELGLGCDIIDEVKLDGVVISSTYIRSLIQEGDMERAVRFLGHPHTLSGQVTHGRQLGRSIGVPTSNLALPDRVLAPAHGVYAARVWIGGESYPAVTNVGVRPTVDSSGQVSVEPWILGFDGDLYGRTIRVEFYKRLRPEHKFAGLDELRHAILRDAAQTREYFEGGGRDGNST